MNAGDEIQRHLVVFDCNIYLDAASLLGQPFSWEAFETSAARLAKAPFPDRVNRANDSLRALAASTSGRFAGDEALEVWTSSHIDTIVRGKARQPTIRDPSTGYQGLGWSEEAAQALVEDLIYGIVDRSGGGTVGDLFPDGNPPLDHEDGMVFGACRYLAREDPLAKVYCVTRDRGFIEASASGALSRHSRVMPPALFVGLLKEARIRYSMRRMSK